MSTSVATPRRRRNRRRLIVWAIVASLVLHFIIILTISTVVALRPVPVEETVQEEEAVEFTLIDPPSTPRDPTYVETSESQSAEKPPERPNFESNNDTEAASSLPASGDAPVPTQEGEENPGLEFQNQQYTAGAQSAQTAVPPPVEAQPVATPAPTPVEPPKPQPTPRGTTPLALLEPPKQEEEPKPTQATPQQTAPPTPNQPAKPATPGFQPETRITRIRGNISNRGRSSVAAAATPLGRYKKMLSDAIGSRWYYYVNEQLDLLNIGTLEVLFTVTESGKVEGIRVVRNSSNESFAACSVRAIMEAEIPPIPKEIVPMLDKGRIEIEYSFTILSN